MLKIPGLTDTGMDTDELVELVDVFPTLAEAAGLPVPPMCPSQKSEHEQLCTEGTSWMPLVQNISSSSLKWKEAVFSQYPKPDTRPPGMDPDFMGYSIRTKRYRYSEWINFTWGSPEVWPIPHSVELYDLDRDPRQNYNRASDPAYADVINELSDILHQGWTGA